MRYLVTIGRNRFGARNVGLVGCIRTSVDAIVHLVPRVQSEASMEDAMVTMGVPREWQRMMLSLTALIVVMARIKGWMFNSKIGWFSDATFKFPKSVVKLAI